MEAKLAQLRQKMQGMRPPCLGARPASAAAPITRVGSNSMRTAGAGEAEPELAEEQDHPPVAPDAEIAAEEPPGALDELQKEVWRAERNHAKNDLILVPAPRDINAAAKDTAQSVSGEGEADGEAGAAGKAGEAGAPDTADSPASGALNTKAAVLTRQLTRAKSAMKGMSAKMLSTMPSLKKLPNLSSKMPGAAAATAPSDNEPRLDAQLGFSHKSATSRQQEQSPAQAAEGQAKQAAPPQAAASSAAPEASPAAGKGRETSTAKIESPAAAEEGER